MIRIRPTEPADKPAWHRMRCALWPDEPATELLADLDRMLTESRFANWIALDGAAAVAFAEATLRPYANGCDSQPVVFLEGIWVAPSRRRQGIGRQLMGAVEQWALDQGIREVGSDALLDNTLSHASHRGWGFAETERVVYFRKKLA